MALSAAFSMARIIIGVANTGGSIASLNWLARCAGVTRSVKVPLAPSGIGRMRHHSWFAPDGSAPRRRNRRRTVVFPIHRMYEVEGGTAKIVARSSNAARDSRVILADVHGLRGPTSKGAMRGYRLDIGGDHRRVVRGL